MAKLLKQQSPQSPGAHRILVVGADIKHPMVDMVRWPTVVGDSPTFGDYDHVILYMPSIQEQHGSSTTRNWSDMKQKVQDAMHAKVSIICVTAVYTPVLLGGFPFKLEARKEPGKRFKSEPPSAYFTKVKEWDHCFEPYAHPTRAHEDWNVDIKWATKHGFPVAFTVRGFNFDDSAKEVEMGSIDFIPPQTSTTASDNIKAVINEFIVADAETPPADYVHAIKMDDEVALEATRTDLRKKMAELESERERSEAEYGKLQFKKSTICRKGRPLVRGLVQLLSEMGVELEGLETFEEDKMLVVGEHHRLPVEIKGHDKSASDKDLLQLLGRLEKAQIPDGAKVKGILFVNGWVGKPPAERPETFHPNLVAKSIPWGIRLVDVATVYEAWRLKLLGNDAALIDLLVQQPGLLELPQSHDHKENSSTHEPQ